MTQTMTNPRPYNAALLVPTGIGCAMGGYAGDALPIARLLAEAVDQLVTHPNVLNGAQLYWPMENVLYVEGYGLDQFAAGNWALENVHRNAIGVVFDAGIEPELRLRHLQVMDGARATLGLELTDYVMTDRPLGVTLKTSGSGSSWGTIAQPDSLLRAAETLIKQAGARAIAVIARFPDEDSPVLSQALQNYRQGQGVDGLAGAEAVISHLVVRQFQIPCAHAPALIPLPLDPSVAPRSAAEEIGYTFLPCVLAGLSRAPQYRRLDASPQRHARQLDSNLLIADQIHAVITPASACGGSALLSWAEAGAHIIAVEENQTALNVPPEPLGIKVTRVASYLEAVGVIVGDRAGISPLALRPQIPSLRCINP